MQTFIEQNCVRERRIKIVTVSIFVLFLVQQIIGWSFYFGQYIFKRRACTFNLNAKIICEKEYKYYEYGELYCSDFPHECQKAYHIRTLFFNGTTIPLFFFMYIMIFSFWYFCCSSRQYGCLRCSYFIWSICLLASVVQFFQDAKNVQELDDTYQGDVNRKVLDGCVGLSVLCIFIILLLFGLIYDLHQQIKSSQVDQEPRVQNQQSFQCPQMQQQQQSQYQQPNIIMPSAQIQIQQQYMSQYNQKVKPQNPQVYALQTQLQPPQGQPTIKQVQPQEQQQYQAYQNVTVVQQFGQVQIITPQGEPQYIKFSNNTIISIQRVTDFPALL